MTQTQCAERFSQRERQIVEALLEAKAIKDIALELHLSVNTVKDYLKTIYRKAQVHSARELMLLLGPAAPPPPPDAALARFLAAAQAVAADTPTSHALPQLAAAVRRCTRAQRVSFWHVVRGPGEYCLAREAGSGTLQPGAFVGRILDHGWARLEAAEQGSVEACQLAAAGLRGEVMGIACSAPPRVQILLMADPVSGSFGALDLAAVRLLARLSQSPDPHHPATLAASA